MPIKKAAKKAIRQNVKQKSRNLARKKEMKDVVKQIKDLNAKKENKEIKNLVPKAYKAIDKAAKRGIIKPNTASRKKSQVARMAK